MLSETHPLRKAQEFLLALFKTAPKEQWVEFRAIRGKASKRPNDPPTVLEGCTVGDLEPSFDRALAEWIARKNQQRYDIYFGVCPRVNMRRSTSSGHLLAGNAKDVERAVCAWVDLDTDKWEQVIQFANTSDSAPSIVVFTGHGAHLYFLYPESVLVSRATADSKKLAEKLGGDSTSDAPRILRVPGTKNWKTDPPEECRLVSMNLKRFHSPAAEEGAPQSLADVPFDIRTVIMQGHSAAQPPLIKEDEEKDRSQIDFRVMVRLFVLGFSEEQVLDIFTNPDNAISAKVFDEKERGNAEHYLAISIRKAQAKAEVEKMKKQEIGAYLLFENTKQLATAPKLKFAVQQVMPVGGMAFVTGPAKVGKSLLTADLALLLSGCDGLWMERLQIHIPGPTAIIQSEITRGSLKYRMNTIAASRGKVWEDFPLFFYCNSIDLGDPRHISALTNGLKRNKIQYLIIDPLARFHRKNENRMDDMSYILSNIEKAGRDAELLGIFVVHHHGKPSADAPREGAMRARGASVIADWGNAHVVCQKLFSSSSDQKYVRISFELRDAEEPDPMHLSLDKNSLRFVEFNEEDNRLAVVMGVIDSDLEQKNQVEEVRSKLGIRKSEAERLISKARVQKKFGTPEAESA